MRRATGDEKAKAKAKGGDGGRAVWDAKAAAHLLSRTNFAAVSEEVARFAALPMEEAVDLLLNEAESAPTPSKPQWVREPWVNTERRYADTKPEDAAASHRETRSRYSTELNDLRSWWLGQMIATKAPLRELMTLFWHSHFATSAVKVQISQAVWRQNDVLRRHALGRFRGLLREMTTDPAMMIYLDLEDSDKAKPNENYARELYELFTVGIGNYTERDIKETARALTGWTLDAGSAASPAQDRATAPNTPRDFARDGLTPTLRQGSRDGGEVTIFGRSGRFGVDEVVESASSREATGRFLAAKLIAFFGAADPAGALRERISQSYRDSGTSIRAVLRTLFLAPEFYDPASRGSLIKSPARLLVGACRQLKVEARATPSLAQMLAAMGQELFNPPNVKGWPEGEPWISAGTLAVRYHLSDALLDSREPSGLEPLGFDRFLTLPRDEARGQAMMGRIEAAMTERRDGRKKEGIVCRFRPEALFPQGEPQEPEALVDAMLDRLVVATVRPSVRQALIDACRELPPSENENRTALVARLIIASPEYQIA